MDFGVGFLVGVMIGLTITGIIVFIYLASRRVSAASRADAGGSQASAAKPGLRNATTVMPRAAVSPQPSARLEGRPAGPGVSARQEGPAAEPGGDVVQLDKTISGELQLAHNVKEVRAMLLSIAGVVSRTNAASDKAAIAFNSAKDAIDGMALGDSTELTDAQGILMGEIDRLLKTNSVLKGALEQANQGIVEQRRQIEELRERTRIDGLTGINNRAAFDDRLKEYLAVQERQDRSFTLLMLDIDFFKHVNDALGHVCGDRVLRGVAQKIAVSIRANDFAARYGGEEFTVIFPETRISAALEVAERMRRDIAKANFRLDSQSVKITISGGMVESAKGMSGEELVAAADHALYNAKNRGRNCLSIAGSE